MRNVGRSIVFFLVSLTASSALAQVSFTIRTGNFEPPVLNLPFSADQEIRVVQQLANGITLTHEMKGRVYRSASGVERFEAAPVATNPLGPAPVTMVWLIDPVQHRALHWSSNSTIATLIHLPENATATVRFLPEAAIHIGQPPPVPANKEIPVTTDLGRQSHDGLLLVGKRLTTTIPVGQMGNEEPIIITMGGWFSPELKLLVKELSQNPLSGNRSFELTHVRLGEPEAALFEAPSGYTVTDQPNRVPGGQLDGGPLSPEMRQIAEVRKDPDPAHKDELAYKLAMDKTDIPDALSLAEQAVSIQEQRTTNINWKNSSADEFAQMRALARCWHTLGFIYLRTGDLPKAEAYIHAAWELDHRGYFGAHLGAVYTLENRNQDAILIYRRVLSSRASDHEKQTVQNRLADLGAANATPLPITMTVALPPLDASVKDANAILDILQTQSGPPDVLFVSGSPELTKPLAAAIQASQLAALPDSGPERVVRRAHVVCTSSSPGCSLTFLSAQEADAALPNGN